MASYRAGHFGSVAFGEFMPGETIQSVTKKDGRITVASVMDQESLAEVAEGLVACSCEYVLDAKTRELISASIVDTYDDGEVYHGTVEFIYDGELPGRGKELLNYANQTENLRTITVVSNPGTTEENIRSVQVVKGVLVVPYTESSVEEDFCVYSDAACTQDYDFSEGDTSDVTIYVKWGE
jgi:hypothetical protein